MAIDKTIQCYAYANEQDSVRLKLISNQTTMTGDLTYNLSGKDRNTGTLVGQMNGDTLLAEYTFQSEGTESVREVAFLMKENGLVEGYGNVWERAGKMVFENKSSLTFEANRVLAKTDCRE
ncbi:MAG: hypothetical protein LH606_15085 [Cytophagaceae bacterium]|nr:hypothetical protein [Cytophagaceae bacterium]